MKKRKSQNQSYMCLESGMNLFNIFDTSVNFTEDVSESRPEGMDRSYRLKRGPVFQMLVLPTHPLGGSVIFSFSKSSWMD